MKVEFLDVKNSLVLEMIGADIWRCLWNFMGTVFSTSGDNGMFQLRKTYFRGNWECISQLNRNTAANVHRKH